MVRTHSVGTPSSSVIFLRRNPFIACFPCG